MHHQGRVTDLDTRTSMKVSARKRRNTVRVLAGENYGEPQ